MVLKWHFHINILRNVWQKPFEEPGCSLSCSILKWLFVRVETDRGYVVNIRNRWKITDRIIFAAYLNCVFFWMHKRDTVIEKKTSHWNPDDSSARPSSEIQAWNYMDSTSLTWWRMRMCNATKLRNFYRKMLQHRVFFVMKQTFAVIQ